MFGMVSSPCTDNVTTCFVDSFVKMSVQPLDYSMWVKFVAENCIHIVPPEISKAEIDPKMT